VAASVQQRASSPSLHASCASWVPLGKPMVERSWRQGQRQQPCAWARSTHGHCGKVIGRQQRGQSLVTGGGKVKRSLTKSKQGEGSRKQGHRKTAGRAKPNQTGVGDARTGTSKNTFRSQIKCAAVDMLLVALTVCCTNKQSVVWCMLMEFDAPYKKNQFYII
jgi:hypothetical protein